MLILCYLIVGASFFVHVDIPDKHRMKPLLFEISYDTELWCAVVISSILIVSHSFVHVQRGVRKLVPAVGATLFQLPR